MRSAPVACGSHGRYWNACTASVWKSGNALTPRAVRTRSAISRTGWTVPISLFACITETRTVPGPSAALSARMSSTPSRVTGTERTATPSRSRSRQVSSTDSCSIEETTSSGVRSGKSSRNRFTTPRSTTLFASVAEPVKMTSRKSAPSAVAIRSRAASSAAIASCPNECTEPAFPNRVPKYGRIARATAWSTGVVAA